jgi:hypothetical protein
VPGGRTEVVDAARQVKPEGPFLRRRRTAVTFAVAKSMAMTGFPITLRVLQPGEAPSARTTYPRTGNAMATSGTRLANCVGSCAWESGRETEWRGNRRQARSSERISGTGRSTATISHIPQGRARGPKWASTRLSRLHCAWMLAIRGTYRQRALTLHSGLMALSGEGPLCRLLPRGDPQASGENLVPYFEDGFDLH